MRKLLLPAVAAALAAVVAASAEPLPRSVQAADDPGRALQTQMSSLEQQISSYGPSANSPSTTRAMGAGSIGGRP